MVMFLPGGLDQIEPSILGEDWANCFVIAVQSPVQPSRFIAVGNNLSDPENALAAVFLSHLQQVLSERRCLMIEGRARLRQIPGMTPSLARLPSG